MAQEGSEGSVANSSTTPNFWDQIHTSSWNNVLPWQPHHHHQNPNSNSSCEEDISISNSFTNTSNHSGLSEDSSRLRLFAPHASTTTNEPTSENHLWNQVLLSVGSTGDLHNSRDAGENFLEALSSKNLSATDMYAPACDYLKKMDNGWEFPNSASFNNLEKQLNNFNGNLLEHERLTNLVSNWSIALPLPPDQANRQMSTNSIEQFSDSDLSQMKQNMSNSPSFGGVTDIRNSGFYPCYGNEHLKVESQHQTMDTSEASFLRSLKSSTGNNNNMRYQMGSNNPVTGENNKYYYGMLDAPWCNNTKNLSDIISFNGCLSKPMVDIPSSKPSIKASNSSEPNKKHGHDSSMPQTRGSGRGSGKKRCEDTSETVFKKPKHDPSTVSALKAQVPKVKLGDRITALQQIVSPFGKTDTASVLQEAIGYIKFLQEQVQLLSNPYVKPNTNKDPWGLLLESSRKEKAGGEGKVLDLKSRGLCLVPVSCTPQVYRENTGSDYWTPTYRGSLYR